MNLEITLRVNGAVHPLVIDTRTTLLDALRERRGLEHGFVLTDRSLGQEHLAGRWEALGRRPLPFETSYPGLFAAGDVRAGSIKRVAAAVGEGSAAVRSVHEYLAFAH